MSKKQFSMKTYWDEVAKNHRPSLAFDDFKGSYEEWRAQALPTLQTLLGKYPEKVPLDAEVEYSVEMDGLIRERVVFDTEEHMSIPCIVLRPASMKPDGTNAAVICVNGHGPYGKDPVAGIRSSPGHISEIVTYNFNYGEQMAQAGFMAICPELRVFGERRDGRDPFGGSDPCNVNFIKGGLLGIYTLTLNIWDMMCCVDYLETRPEVDKNRIGMMGLSQGGTMTTFTAAVEPRIRAANIMGYLNSWKGFAIRRANFCGSQMVPGVYAALDTHDIAGLIAPRPLLVDMGLYDSTFYIQDLLASYAAAERIYQAAGAGHMISSDIHPHGHSFGGNKAFGFFKTHLLG